MTFKEWFFRCESCDKTFGEWLWGHDVEKAVCPACNQPVELYVPERGKSAGIVDDSIPGGIEIRHLSRHPERFYSKTDIKRRANEQGFNWHGDSPQPYKVKWSGKTRDPKAPNV